MKMHPALLSVLATLPLSASAGPFSEDAHTLFLAHFDRSLTADIARGVPEPTAGAAGITTGNGGRFGEGVICKSGPARDANGRQISFAQFSYELKDNLDLTKGTLEFWVRMDDLVATEPGKMRLRYFFDIPTKEKDNAGNFIRVTIVLWERDGQQILHVFPGTLIATGVHKGESAALRKTVVWSSGEWHHVAIVWDGSELRMFLDGKAGPPFVLPGGLFGGNSAIIGALEGKFLIGGLARSNASNSPEGVLDEFRISDKVRYHDDFDPSK